MEQKPNGYLSYEEAEANRNDPQWGDPVMHLLVHASHWLESATALHPDLEKEMDELADRLSVAAGELAAKDDDPRWISRGGATTGEVVLALAEIVEVMLILAPLVSNPEVGH